MLSKLKHQEVQSGDTVETSTKRFPKIKNKKRLIIIAVVVVLIAAIIMNFLPGGQQAGGPSMSYTEEQVSIQTITKSLTGSGTLQPANSYTVTTLIEGEVLAAEFEEGDIVEQDTILYQIDSSDAATNIEKAQISLNQAQRSYDKTMDSKYVTAETGGILHSLDVNVGDKVNQGQTLATIRDNSTMTLKVPFPADDAVSFYVGQTAEVMLDGSFETLSGTVTAISGSDIIGTGNMITRNVTIAVHNPGGLGNTQSASVSINGIGCSGNGMFTYQAESTMTASSSGTVEAIHVSEGQSVSEGQTILTLGGDNLDDQVQSAADSLRNAELSMENTQKQLENYTITSPISGTVIDKSYKTGDTVESGRTLCTIYDLSYLEMTLNIDELDISTIEVGQRVNITADAVSDKSFKGVITKVSVAGTTSGGITSYPVTVRIDDTNGLLPGMNVDAEIVLAQAENTMAIPASAVVRGGGNSSMVLITQDSPSAINAEEREAPEGYVYVRVEPGVSDDSYVQIMSGLQEGDTVAYIARTTSNGGFAMGMMPGGMPSGGIPSRGGMPSGGGMPGGGGGFPG